MLALVGVVTALFGWIPRFAGAVGWVIVGFAAAMTTFGGLLEVPDLLIELNLFGHLAEYPVEDFRWTPVLVLSAVGAAGVGLGLVGWNRREVNRV